MKRIIAAAVILFFILPGIAFAQCAKQSSLTQYVLTEGVTNGIDNYYQNLIIQDIALANRKAFKETSLKFDYDIRYVTDQCRAGQLEIKLLSLSVNCHPLYYQGYDISSSVKPEKADLVFLLIHEEGFVFDSLIFYDIAIEKDSNFYTSLTFVRNDTNSAVSVSFSRAAFNYTQSSYETFRDRMLQIDQYYAASLIADSALAWAAGGFLSESGGKAEMILKQTELERIIHYISPAKFDQAFLRGQYDLAGLMLKYDNLVRISNRYKAIINYSRFEPVKSTGAASVKKLMKDYIDRFEHYHQLAYKSDFHFVNFIEGLATPDFNNASLLEYKQSVNQIRYLSRNSLRLWCSLLAEGFIEKGHESENSGNQLRALTYFQAASDLSRLMHFQEIQSSSSALVCRMMADIFASYLEISRRSALKESPVMAAKYFHDAKQLYEDNDIICSSPATLNDYEKWLYDYFENQVVRCIELKNYNKAIIYLNEINTRCSMADSYRCPDLYHEWMRTAREGVYQGLLKKSQDLFERDELDESGQLYRQAIAMRMKVGYRINKDVAESKLEIKFRQIQYDELYEEGNRYFKQEEYISALYYFNKAEYLGRFSLVLTHPELDLYRQEAVRQIMLQKLADGRVKAWGHDFIGAGTILSQLKGMLSDYQIAANDSLTAQYLALEENVRQSECELVYSAYNDLMIKADVAKNNNDYIYAYELVLDAINLSLDKLACRIRDGEAWYQKIMLESAADFQLMERKMNDLIDESGAQYLAAFHDLKQFYYRNKLLEQGVVFIPLFDRVMQVQDTAFLAEMLNHYILQKDYNHALKLLQRLMALGYPSVNTEYEQISMANFLARRDAFNVAAAEPWKILESYTGHDKWFRKFNWAYKHTWLKETKWKMKYWPVIWKK